MTRSAFIDQMDNDLADYKDFDSLTGRVAYWNRRLALRAHTDAEADIFNEVVSKHSQRVLGVMRAG